MVIQRPSRSEPVSFFNRRSGRHLFGPRFDGFFQLLDGIGKLASAETFPPVDDGHPGHFVVVLAAFDEEPIVRLLRVGSGTPLLDELQIKHIVGDVVVIPKNIVRDALDRIYFDHTTGPPDVVLAKCASCQWHPPAAESAKHVLFERPSGRCMGWRWFLTCSL